MHGRGFARSAGVRRRLARLQAAGRRPAGPERCGRLMARSSGSRGRWGRPAGSASARHHPRAGSACAVRVPARGQGQGVGIRGARIDGVSLRRERGDRDRGSSGSGPTSSTKPVMSSLSKTDLSPVQVDGALHAMSSTGTFSPALYRVPPGGIERRDGLPATGEMRVGSRLVGGERVGEQSLEIPQDARSQHMTHLMQHRGAQRAVVDYPPRRRTSTAIPGKSPISISPLPFSSRIRQGPAWASTLPGPSMRLNGARISRSSTGSSTAGTPSPQPRRPRLPGRRRGRR